MLEHTQETSEEENSVPQMHLEADSQLRQKASRVHLSALGCGLLLWYPWRMKRSTEAFVAHHGRQAFWLSFGLLMVFVVHVSLHLLITLAKFMQSYAFDGTGTPPPGWIAPALLMVTIVNTGAMIVEFGIGFYLALSGARAAARGEWMEYFFLKKTKAK